MKKLLLLLTLSLISTQGLVEDSEVYYCDELQHLFIKKDTVEKYKLERFKFKKENDFITLTGSSFGGEDNWIPYTQLDIIDDYKGEIFARNLEHSMTYTRDNGSFQYSHLNRGFIHIIFAKCEIF